MKQLKFYYAYDANAEEFIVNPNVVIITPGGRNIRVATYPKKRLDAGDTRGSYEQYRKILICMPEGPRKEEFKSFCKKSMSEYRAAKKKKEIKVDNLISFFCSFE